MVKFTKRKKRNRKRGFVGGKEESKLVWEGNKKRLGENNRRALYMYVYTYVYM